MLNIYVHGIGNLDRDPATDMLHVQVGSSASLVFDLHTGTAADLYRLGMWIAEEADQVLRAEKVREHQTDLKK